MRVDLTSGTLNGVLGIKVYNKERLNIDRPRLCRSDIPHYEYMTCAFSTLKTICVVAVWSIIPFNLFAGAPVIFCLPRYKVRLGRPDSGAFVWPLQCRLQFSQISLHVLIQDILQRGLLRS